MYSNEPGGRFGGGGMGGGLTGEVPKDIWILLGIILATLSLGFFSATKLAHGLLSLTPLVWQKGFIWQLVTYPFVGTGDAGFWFLVELLILFMFGRDVYSQLGRRGFWTLLVAMSVAGSVMAVAVQILLNLGGAVNLGFPFVLMQGQHMLIVILIAAFATLRSNATIHLFFVLPVQARWFLGLEVLFAFLGLLRTHDLAGFLGICAAVGGTWMLLSQGGGLRPRELWLRLQAAWIRLRLGSMKKRRGFQVIRGDKDDKEPWIH